VNSFTNCTPFHLAHLPKHLERGTLFTAMLAALENLEKFYGGQDVLNGVNFSVQPGDRVALVGRNGAGKSTVLKLLAGLEEPSGGRVLLAPNLSIRLLAQDPVFTDGTIGSLVESAFTELDELEARMRALESRLETPEAQIEYHELEEHYRLRGGYARNSRRDMVLSSLEFKGREWESVAGLSGGERTRLALAQILVAQPELLLLDEPTNHLDIQMLEWLESFLRGYPGAILCVSHDRAFLDAVATKTALVSRGEIRSYDGNYTAFRERRDAELEIQARTYQNEQRELERLESLTEQMRIWGHRNEKLAIRARSMQKRVERFADDLTDAPPPDEKVARVRFTAPESGEIVLIGAHLEKRFGARTLFKNVDVTVRRQERIAVLGRNGAGKTTLVRVLMGVDASDDPRAFTRLGSRVRVGYYDQQLRGVDPDNTLFQEISRYVQSDQEVHDLLGAYLFPYDAQYKKIKSLSGGERARLALLKLSLEEYNFLVLDEPTNHLDMEMVESLETALKAFTGTLIIVSHDRRFIENIANHVWLIENATFHTYPGGYAYYKQKHQPYTPEAKPDPRATEKAPVKKGVNPWKLKAELESVEGQIAALEAEQGRVTAELASPTSSTDFAALGKRNAEIDSELLEAMTRWEELSAQLEA
jgi:ATP-binding cassette, subfamily F, member 3